MSRFKNILTTILCLTIIWGCNNRHEKISPGEESTELTILSLSASVGDDGVWCAGDQIGVAVYSQDGVVGSANSCYCAATSGGSVEFSSTDPAYYPASGVGSVFAYYPYDDELLSMEAVNIDVNHVFDNMMVASKSSSNYGEPLELEFSPLLSCIEFSLTAASGADVDVLNNVSISIEGLYTTANYSVKDGTFELGERASLLLSSPLAESRAASDESYSSYVIPQSIGDEVSVLFSFDNGATSTSYDLDMSSIDAGSTYSYTASVSDSGVEITSLIISKWKDGGSQSFTSSNVPDGYTPIVNAEKLIELLNATDDGLSMDGNYILMDDIVLDSQWSGPELYYNNSKLTSGDSGYDKFHFKGIFDGNGKSVTFTITDGNLGQTSGARAALFYCNMGTIKNLTVKGSITVLSDGQFGSIAVINGEGGVISNCRSSVAITSTCSSSSTTWAGGIVGSMSDDAKLFNCYNDGDIDTGTAGCYVGGIVGYMEPGETKTLMNVYNTGTIKGHTHVGDVVGELNLSRAALGTTINPIYDYLFAVEGSGNKIIGYVNNNASSSTNSVEYSFDNCYHIHFSDSELKSDAFVQILNNGAYTTMSDRYTGATDLAAWVSGGSYPELDLSNSPAYLEIEGFGTKEFPYILNSASDLITLSNEVAAGDTKKGVYYAIVNHITLSTDSWTPIGTKEHRFEGHFEGYQLSEDMYPSIVLNINSYNVQYNALFGVVGESAVIQNVTVDGNVTGNYFCAGIAAINYGQISNSVNECYVTTTGAYCYVAGIAAVNMSSGTISDCHNAGNIYENGAYVTIGGVVATNYASSSSITNPKSDSGAVTIKGYKTIHNSSNNYAIGKQE